MKRVFTIAGIIFLFMATTVVYGVAAKHSHDSVPQCTSGCETPPAITCSPEDDASMTDSDKPVDLAPNIIVRMLEIY
ncbi:MAG TPA: hypothetical protein VGD17_02525 [Chitinophagaceae bacterium]